MSGILGILVSMPMLLILSVVNYTPMGWMLHLAGMTFPGENQQPASKHFDPKSSMVDVNRCFRQY